MIPETEIIRALIAVGMFGVAGYFDLKSRDIHDYVFIAFAGLGAIMYIFDGTSNQISFYVASGIVGAVVAGIAWYLKLIGTADIFAMLALSLILPAFLGFPVPIVVIIVGSVISVGFSAFSNSMKNMVTVATEPKDTMFFFDESAGTMTNLRGFVKHIFRFPLFQDVDEPLYKKFFAFFMIHKKSEDEKFAFSATKNIDGKLKFVFFHNVNLEGFVTIENDSPYVTKPIPFMPIFGIALVLMLLAFSFGRLGGI